MTAGNPDESAGLWLVSPAGLSVVAGVALAAHLVWFGQHVVDDAFITMRYALHWASGAGPVFNVGEPPVEGYTSFVWLLLLSAVARLGFDLVLPSMLLGGLCGVAAVVLVIRLRLLPGTFSGPWAGIFCATGGCFVAWSTSGLEVGLFALLLLLCWAWMCAGPLRGPSLTGLSVLLALAVLTRPEASLMVATMLAWLLFTSPSGQALPRLRRVILLFGPCAAVLALHLAWRWSYYGYPLPNTFYAKVGATGSQVARGFRYLGDFLTAYGPLAGLAATGAWLGREDERVRSTTAFVLLFTSYVVAVGGDNFSMLRFFAPIFPFLALLAGFAVDVLARRRRMLAFTLGAAVAVLTTVPSWWGRHIDGVRHDSEDVRAWSRLGRFLSSHLNAGESIALNPVGAVGYYANDVQIIDMLGLNDAVIAHRPAPQGMGTSIAGHEKADAGYVLQRHPELIFLGDNHPVLSGYEHLALTPVFVSDEELLALPELEVDYGPILLHVAKDLTFMPLRRRPSAL